MQGRIIATEQYFGIIKQQLAECGSALVNVTGNSMRPLLRHLQDRVRLTPVKELRVGDVVLFERNPDRFALHRVIRLRGECFDMMGDNQWAMERGLPRSQIVGTVSCFIRDGRELPADGWKMRAYSVIEVIRAYPRSVIGCILRPFVRLLRRLGGKRA